MKVRILRGAAAASLLCVGLVAMGAAFAQDVRSQQTQDEYSSSSSTTPPNQSTTSESSSSKHTTMKECVQRERRADSTMSEPEAKQTCQDAMRAKRDNHDNEPQPPHQR